MTDPIAGNLLDTLHDPAVRKRLDPRGMVELVEGFPAQCRQAWGIAESLPGMADTIGRLRSVVVTGLGGSAIGGDLAKCLVDADGTLPLIVNRDYGLPHFVGPDTLVVAISYSGDTEETLSAYTAARRAGARLAVITSGGKLAGLASDDGALCAIVPGGQPPRSATGYLLFPLLAILDRCGALGSGLNAHAAETLNGLEGLALRYGASAPTAENRAKEIASALYGTLPVIYGSQGYCGAAAYRWKCQFNENSKQAAFAGVFPEQNHNEIVGWKLAGRQAPAWSVVYLRDPDEAANAPQTAVRVAATRELMEPGATVIEAEAEGCSLLARLMSLVYLGDFVSLYTAYLNDVCPTEIQYIDLLKRKLRAAGCAQG